MVIYSTLYRGVLDKVPTNLGKKVFQDYKDLEKSTYGREFKKKYSKVAPLKVNYQYNVLSLYTNLESFKLDKDNFENLDINEHLDVHSEVIEETLPNLYREMDFDMYYKENILKEYLKICHDIEEVFDNCKYFKKHLSEFWKLSFDPELIFIPNFLSTGDCFGIRKEKNFFSITSAKINRKTGLREYSSGHVLSNAIHEFSHSFLDQSMEELQLSSTNEKLSKEKFRKLEENVIPKEMAKVYGNRYFLECFDRAATLRLKEIMGSCFNFDEIFEKENEMGFIYTETFYRKLKINEKKIPVLIYLEFLKSL